MYTGFDWKISSGGDYKHANFPQSSLLLSTPASPMEKAHSASGRVGES